MVAGDLTEYLEIQTTAEFVTKTELREALRQWGLPISERNLTYYASIGLVPTAIRVGSRGGAYPKVVIEQLAWVIRARNRGQSIESIKELLPLWRWIARSRNEGIIDLKEFELVARRPGLSQEANFAVPHLVSEILQCGDCLERIQWILKDGSPFYHRHTAPLTLSFIMGTINQETGQPELLAWTQLSFPGMGSPNPDDPTAITLGLPIGVDLPGQSAQRNTNRHGCRRRRPASRQKEALPL